MNCRHCLWSSDQRNQEQQQQQSDDNVYHNGDLTADGAKPNIIYANIEFGAQGGGGKVTSPKVKPNDDAVVYSELQNADDLYENVSR